MTDEDKARKDELRKTDIPVASYSRSGNTWLRCLLADVILQQHGFETGTELPIPLDLIIPEAKATRMVDKRITLPFRLVKTHNEFDPRVLKVIYLFRDPADTLCSRHYQKLRYRKKVEDIDTFCLHHLPGWCAHLRSYVLGEGIPIWFVSYERLHEDAVNVLLGVSRFLGLKIDEEMAQIAVDNNTFEKRRASEEKWEATSRKSYPVKFFRKGKVGSAKEELRPETLERIFAGGIDIYLEARRKEEKQWKN